MACADDRRTFLGSPGMMALRPFGSTGLMVSPLALGTVKFGRTKALKYSAAFELPSDAQAADLLALASDLGINLLDTAPAYGVAEERLGRLLEGRRHDWLLCTKAGEEFDEATGQSRFDYSPAHLRHSVERSLKRLRTDTLDIVLVHSNGEDLDVIAQGALDTLADLKAEGKLRSFGLSSKTVQGGIAALEASDCAMVTYSAVHRDELPVLETAAALGKPLLIKKPLASGQVDLSSGENALAEAFGLILRHPAAASIVVGTINPQHLRANAMACHAALTNLSRPPT